MFLPYLWGIETLEKVIKIYDKWKSFYPTYEALKHIYLRYVKYICGLVFTLPMRHWNSIGWITIIQLIKNKFLPYLWGIETRIWLWNARRIQQSFLPYLWGIETQEQCEKQKHLQKGFYPTYEALKQNLLLSILSSNRTVFTLPMRHWNLKIQENPIKTGFCFYPTYEALKLLKGR